MALFTVMLSPVVHAKSQESHYSTYVHDSILQEILIYLADETLSDQEIYEYLEVLEEQYPEVYQMLVAEGLLFDSPHIYQDKNLPRVNKSGLNALLLASTESDSRCKDDCVSVRVKGRKVPIFGEVDVEVEVCRYGCEFDLDDAPDTPNGRGGSGGGIGTGGPGRIGPGGGGLDSDWWDNYQAGGCNGLC